MSADDAIKGFSEKVVIIDDGFAPAALTSIQDDDWAALRAGAPREGWTVIKEAHFPELERITDLKLSNANIAKAWALYDADPTGYSIFDPIFIRIRDQRRVELTRLSTLLEYFESDLRVELCRHPDINSATEDIKQCKLIFLDFYLYQSSPDDIIESIREYSELFNGPVEGEDAGLRRIVILISTDLPSGDKLELFRKASRLKGAFFKAVSKDDLTKEWLRKELFGKISRYGDMQKWVTYLDIFSNQITAASDLLREEIEGLELHDLAILDSVRLQADSEPLGDYLSWLFSEALAARARQSAPLVEAGTEVDRISSTPFHGMLQPKQILFGLYSDIAFSATATDAAASKIRFGNVYSPLKEIQADSATRQEDQGASPANDSPAAAGLELQNDLLLVIAPACDLQRCSETYEVLIVRGKIIDTALDLAGLLGQKPLIGKSDDDAITFRHFLRHKTAGDTLFLKVEWYPKRVTTLPVSRLLDGAKFKQRGRINELLGHEIKEEALRQAGRVGVPVDPSFSSPLSAALHLSRKKKEPFIRQVTESECVAGILVSANEQNASKVLPSEEFLDLLGKLIKEASTVEFPVEGKLLEALLEIQNSTAGIKLGDKGLKEWQGSGFKVRLISEYDPSKFVKENAIIFYPLGHKIESQTPEPPPDLAAAAQSLDTAVESIGRAKDVIVAAEAASAPQGPPPPVPQHETDVPQSDKSS